MPFGHAECKIQNQGSKSQEPRLFRGGAPEPAIVDHAVRIIEVAVGSAHGAATVVP